MRKKKKPSKKRVIYRISAVNLDDLKQNLINLGQSFPDITISNIDKTGFFVRTKRPLELLKGVMGENVEITVC